MGSARLEFSVKRRVERMHPGITRGTAELRHADVIDRLRQRGRREVEHSHQRALAVDGPGELGVSSTNVDVEVNLGAGFDSIDLVVEVVPLREDGPQDVLDAGDFREYDFRERGLLGLCDDGYRAREVRAAVGAVCVGEEM